MVLVHRMLLNKSSPIDVSTCAFHWVISGILGGGGPAGAGWIVCVSSMTWLCRLFDPSLDLKRLNQPLVRFTFFSSRTLAVRLGGLDDAACSFDEEACSS